MIAVSVKIGKAGLELLEALTIPESLRSEKLQALKKHLGVSELVYVATCNRVEFLVSVPSEQVDASLVRNRILDFFFHSGDEKKINFEPSDFRLFAGREAVRHLFEVASSLDSVVIGEAQILGQLKDAYQFCKDQGLCNSVFERLFSAAFKTAKMVRTETELGKKAVSMASLVSIRLDEIIAETPDARIAIIGSGSMTPKMAEIVRKKHRNQVLFVNRTVSKIEPFAQKYNGIALSLEEFLSGAHKVNVVISSTSSERPLFTNENINAIIVPGQRLHGFDLAIPRDFDSALDDSATLEIWNLEKLNLLAQKNRRERFRTVDQANRIIDEQLRIYLQKEITQMISPLFDSALDESMVLAEEGLENLFKSRLAHLSPDDQAVLLHWSKKVLSRACYLPARQLAEKIANHDIEQDRDLSLFIKMAR